MGKKYNQSELFEDGYGTPYQNYQMPLPPITTPVTKPAEIEIPKTKLKNLKTKYSNGENVVNDLRQSEGRREMFEYIDYVYQEFVKCSSELETLTRSYRREIDSNYYLCTDAGSYPLTFLEYSLELKTTLYKVCRIGLKPGDLLFLHNGRTEKNFLPRFIADSPVRHMFSITPNGILYSGNEEILFDVKVGISYQNDIILFSPTSGEQNPFEVTQEKIKKISKQLPEFTKSCKLLVEVFSEILDTGVELDQDIIPEVLIRWQKLTKVTNYEIFSEYESRVARYGTSY